MTNQDRAAPSFLRSVLILMSWTALAQAVSLLGMVVLPRLFLPEQFGVFSVFSGAAVMVGIVAAGRYEFAIGLPDSDDAAAALFTLCVALSALMAVGTWLLLSILPIGAFVFSRLPGLQPWTIAVAVGVACIGWYNAVSYLALRSGRLGIVGRSKAAIAVATAAGQIGGGILVPHSDGALIVPFLAAQLVGCLFIVSTLKDQAIWNRRWPEVVAVARRYARFPWHVAPGSLLDGLAALLPVAVIATTRSAVDAGYYALAERTLRMPVTLIGSSVLQVFYTRMTSIRGDAPASRHLLVTTWRNLALMAFVPCVGLALYGGAFFAFAFGDRWQHSGAVAQRLVIAFFVIFVSYPTSNILVVNERTRSFLAWQVVQVALIGGSLWAAYSMGPGSLESVVDWLVGGQVLVGLFSMTLQWRAVSAGLVSPPASPPASDVTPPIRP